MFKLGLIGKMGAGKTMLSEMVLQAFPGNSKRVAFANQLKEDVITFGLTVDGKIDKARDRSVLQNYGQMRRGELETFDYWAGRVTNNDGNCFLTHKTEHNMNHMYVGNCSATHWVDITLEKIAELEQRNYSVIVDDIRRENEAEALLNDNFIIIKINCNDEIRFARLRERDGSFDPSTLNDISESQVDSLPFTAAITNEDVPLVGFNALMKVLDSVGLLPVLD